ncbi:MAG: hypothetical protein QOI20_3151 [Acidimicrobiaceae bacterium]|jgi:hypothetical protein|nr:hypothetical protein [Acidimicrobiaceae bacterium]
MRVWAVAVALCLGAGACTGGGGGGARGAAGSTTATTEKPTPAGPWDNDIPAEQLVEKPPVNAAARLAEQAARILRFCDAWNQVESFSEPPPDDLRKNLVYAQIYVQVLKQVNFEEGVPKRLLDGRLVKAPVPDDIKQAVATERAEVYAFSIRLAAAKTWADKHMIGPSVVNRIIDRASVKLAGPVYTSADDKLNTFAEDTCRV